MRRHLPALLAALSLLPNLPVLAQQHEHDRPSAQQAPSEAWAEGTVKRVSADTGKVTIAHGPLPALDMPAMTMVFRVKDPAWLARMKPGERIRFVVERLEGGLTVTRFETVQ